jgi:hypothetical protein
MGVEPLEPSQLVVKVRTWHRIAVWQVNRGDPNAEDVRLKVASLSVGLVSRKAAPDLFWLLTAGQIATP